MANDRLEHFALVERADNGSDHVHQFEVLPFHVASEQALRIRSEFKKPAVKLVSELSTDRPDRVERLSDKLSLVRRHANFFTQSRNCDTCTPRSCDARAYDTPRSLIRRTASSLNSRVNFRLSMFSSINPHSPDDTLSFGT